MGLSAVLPETAREGCQRPPQSERWGLSHAFTMDVGSKFPELHQTLLPWFHQEKVQVLLCCLAGCQVSPVLGRGVTRPLYWTIPEASSFKQWLAVPKEDLQEQ